MEKESKGFYNNYSNPITWLSSQRIVLKSRLRELYPAKVNGLDVKDVGSFGRSFFFLFEN